VILLIERTLVLIKPDGIKRCLVGRILQRFEDIGLKIVGAKMMWIDKQFAGTHYRDIGERHGPEILKISTDYITSGPVLALALEGVSVISVVRKIVGSTYPNEAPPGTIRGDFAHISKDYANAQKKFVSNLIHASADQKDAEHELKLWFKPEELHTYKTVHETHTF
jgi:nucleoside-diphosphate kinase